MHWYIDCLANLCSKQGQPQLVEPELQELLAFSRDKDGPDSPVYARHLAQICRGIARRARDEGAS